MQTKIDSPPPQSLPPAPGPERPRPRRRLGAIVGVVAAGLLVAGVVVAIAADREPNRTQTAPAEPSTPPEEIASPSPSPSPAPDVETFLAQFTGELEANSGRSLDYTVLNHVKVTDGKEDVGPMILFVWNDDRGLNEWRVIQRTLRPWYEFLALDYASYGLGMPLKGQGKMWIFVVDIDDFEQVPGPNGQDYVDLALPSLERIPELTPAGVELP